MFVAGAGDRDDGRRRASRAAGPASPTRASARALSPSERAPITAPMNGMNIGALALIPSRRSAITCPISWMKSSTTKPSANCQPQSRL